MSDPLRDLIERERELSRLMNPLTEVGANLGAYERSIVRAAAELDVMSLMRDRADIEARAAGFLSPDQHRNLALDLFQRMPTGSELLMQEMQRADALAREAAGLHGRSISELAVEAASLHQRWEEAFRLPSAMETARLYQEQVDALQGQSMLFHDKPGQIMAAMTSMTRPWLNDAMLDHSVLGMMEMQTIGAVLRHSDPFGADIGDLLRPALGDWREVVMPTVDVLMDPVARTALYYDKGYSPDLTAFPRGAFVEGMHHAGLDLDSSEDLDDDEADADETLEASFARNRSAFDQLQRFEVALRRFIDERMTEAFGPDWCITQAPEGTSDNWRQKQATDAKATGAIRPLIEFADFTDYRAIIEKKQNWKTVFAPVFNRSTDIQESFQRLYPVRIATMHARMITQDDEMLLTVETRRILRAIRKA